MTAPRTAPIQANLKVWQRFFRLESQRLQLPQGVRAALAISVPIGLGLAYHQLATSVIVTLGAWFVLVTDTGGAYRQKAIATLSATVGVGCAVLGASILNVSPLSIIVGTFLWVTAAAFVGIFGNTGRDGELLDLSDVCHHSGLAACERHAGFDVLCALGVGFGLRAFLWPCGHCTLLRP